MDVNQQDDERTIFLQFQLRFPIPDNEVREFFIEYAYLSSLNRIFLSLLICFFINLTNISFYSTFDKKFGVIKSHTKQSSGRILIFQYSSSAKISPLKWDVHFQILKNVEISHKKYNCLMREQFLKMKSDSFS